MVTATLVSSAKRVISRLLVLIVSMGYGITRPSLGETFQQILGLGAMYFVTSSFQEITFNLAISMPQGSSQFMLLLILAVLDVVFIFWIFQARPLNPE